MQKTIIVDGRKIQKKILEDLKKDRLDIKKEIKLGAVLIGSNAQSSSYLIEKERIAKILNIDFKLFNFKENLSRNNLRKYLNKIKFGLDGLIIQLPMPKKFNTDYFLDSIPEKIDIDVLSSKSLGKFIKGKLNINPPGVSAVIEIFKEYEISYKDKIIGIVGRGSLIGKPLANFFMSLGLDVIITGKRSERIKDLLPLCDIIISGIGSPCILKKQMIQKGCICIDFGFSIDKKGKAIGDFDVDGLKGWAKLLTPSIGGTGPITVACLFRNLIQKVKY